jgi:hypothetical protein
MIHPGFQDIPLLAEEDEDVRLSADSVDGDSIHSVLLREDSESDMGHSIPGLVAALRAVHGSGEHLKSLSDLARVR